MLWKELLCVLGCLCVFNIGVDGLQVTDTSNMDNVLTLDADNFSWEALFDDPVTPDDLANIEGNKNTDVDVIQSFLVDFGKSLDHCNMRIEESAEISKYLIRRFMREVIERDSPNTINDISLDNIDFQEKIVEIPDDPDDDLLEGSFSDPGDIWKELSNVLVTVRDGCDNLPITIADIDLNWQGLPGTRTETVLEKILEAMTRWTKHWTNKIQVVSSEFIESCVSLPRCENNLKIITDIISSSLQKTKNLPETRNEGIHLHSVMGSAAFWNAMSSASLSSVPQEDNHDLNSFLRVKLNKMAGILGHFGGLSDSEDLEYIHSSGVNKSAVDLSVNVQLLELTTEATDTNSEAQTSTVGETEDDIRMRRVLAAAVNVLRFPWNVEQPNTAVLMLGGEALVHRVPPTFLSLALESQLLHKQGHKFDTQSAKVRSLMSWISPAVFRVGGSSANFLTFNPSPANDEADSEPSIAPSDEVPPTNTPRTYREHLHKKSYAFGPAYQPKNTISNYYRSLTDKDPGVSTHPKLRLRTNDDRSKKIMATHPKLKFSQKSENTPNVAKTGNQKTQNRSYGREARSISTNHPKFGQHRNSLHHDDTRHHTGRCHRQPHFKNYTVNEGELRGLFELCRALNWTLLFDLNQFTRSPDGAWDPTNARQIVHFARQSRADVIWQVGNEPNHYVHKYPLNMTGVRMAGDVATLRDVVHQEQPLWQRLKEDLGLGTHVTVVGPDVTRPMASGDASAHAAGDVADAPLPFLRQFLAERAGLVDAISWHQYYVCGRTAGVDQFTSPAVMDLFQAQLSAINGVRDQMAPQSPIWITETGSAYGGGAPGLSNRFAGVFLWLDKLGVAAAGGVQVVARQSLWGGNYAMLASDYDPNPDYWVSVVHKLLVGGGVLRADLQGAPPTLRLYAHCTKDTHPLHQPGGVTVFGVNTGSESVSVGVLTEQTPPEGAPAHQQPPQVLQFLLSPALGDLTARTVLLNGTPLLVGADGSLPQLLPQHVDRITAPPRTAGFWVLPGAGVRACG